MQIHTTLTNDEDYSGYAIDSGNQRLSNELNRLLPTSEQEIKNIIRLRPPGLLPHWSFEECSMCTRSLSGGNSE